MLVLGATAEINLPAEIKALLFKARYWLEPGAGGDANNPPQ